MKKASQRILILFFGAGVLFHLLALLGFIPTEILWGGRITEKSQLRVFELISLGLNGTFLMFVLVDAGYLKWRPSKKWSKVFYVLLTLLFSLNTLGNLNAIHPMERIIFTPITLLLALLSAYMFKTQSNAKISK